MIRPIVSGWLFHFKHLARSPIEVAFAVTLPIILATLTVYLFAPGPQGAASLEVLVGVGMMGVWSMLLAAAGSAIQMQRWQGLLETLVGAPAPFALALLAYTLAATTLAFYSLVATVAWGWVVFGVPVTIAHPALALLALVASVFALGAFGLVLASTFVLLRNANALVNALSFPVWLVAGMLVPLSLLPGWVTPISWFLPPRWAAEAIGEAVAGEAPLFAIAMCWASGAAYLLLGITSVGHFERLARERAVLALT